MDMEALAGHVAQSIAHTRHCTRWRLIEASWYPGLSTEADVGLKCRSLINATTLLVEIGLAW